MVNILVADNSPVYIHGLLYCLRSLPVVAEVACCNSYADMEFSLKSGRFNIIFLELYLGNSGEDGFDKCKQISHLYPGVCIAVLSRYSNRQFIAKARQCGAHAYFDKHCNPEIITQFVVDAEEGKITDYRIKATGTLAKAAAMEAIDRFELKQLISKREEEVMKLIVGGTNPRDIQARLGISYETFRSHHNAVLNKLKVANDVELTRLAINNRLFDH